MRMLVSAGAMAVALLSVPFGMSASFQEKENVTLTGCVIVGDGGGFLLTDRQWPDMSGGNTQGTSGVNIRDVYWLDDDDKIKGHTGHRMVITGESEGDLEKGEVEIDRHDEYVEIKVKSDGKDVSARLPLLPITVGTGGRVADDAEVDFVVRKVEVKTAEMLAPSCDSK